MNHWPTAAPVPDDHPGDPVGLDTTPTMDRTDSPAAAEGSTGDAVVDAAVARLEALDGRDLDQHAEVFDDINRRLGSVLDGTSEDGRAGGAQAQREDEGP